jgi:hypothetical protein
MPALKIVEKKFPNMPYFCSDMEGLKSENTHNTGFRAKITTNYSNIQACILLFFCTY